MPNSESDISAAYPDAAVIRGRTLVALAAFLIAAALPSKEMSWAVAVVMLTVLRPLEWHQVVLVLQRCWPVLAMLAIGLAVTLIDLSDGYDKRAVVRIAFYYIRIPTFLLLGFAARRYARDDRLLLWGVIALGAWGAAQTLFRYVTGGDLAGLNHNELRSVVGSGDTISILIPLCALTLWRHTSSAIPKAALCGASALAVLGVIAASSRTGFLVLAISGVLSLPRVKPLIIARWGSVVILIATFILTTPALPAFMTLLGIDPLQFSSLAEIIARPRTDLQSINEQWRGYETYMAFVASTRDGLLPLLVGHGMSAFAPLGVLIELAPGEMFDRADVFHNGWSFIVLHSGLIGAMLYAAQFYVLASPPAMADGFTLRKDNRLFAMILLSLASSTAVVAGAFNAGTFASAQLFLIGCFYPYSLVPVGRPVPTALPAARRCR